jgi:hypothetical protein
MIPNTGGRCGYVVSEQQTRLCVDLTVHSILNRYYQQKALRTNDFWRSCCSAPRCGHVKCDNGNDSQILTIRLPVAAPP